MLYPMKDLLDHALKNNYAVMAPSIRNEDCARAAVEVAQEMHSPVILNVNRHAWSGMQEPKYWRYQTEVLRQIAINASVPVAINLDHSPSYEECVNAVVAGFTSVMIDHSDLPFEENIRLTKEVVKMAHAAGVSVEAELGHVGVSDESTLAGIQDEKQRSTMASASKLTIPEELKRFVEETGVDCVAVSIGNQHGAYKNNITPHIDFELLDRLHQACPEVPLVLHGGSGTGDENIHRACSMAICKVNVGTDCEKAAAMAVVNAYQANGKVPPAVYNVMREGYKSQVYHQIDVMGSANKAW